MPLSQTVLWTALPDGVDADDPGTLRLSVLVSPRLATGGDPAVLGDFEDFVDWPGRLRSARFAVEVTWDRMHLDAEHDPDRADAGLWAALLPPETPVEGHEFVDRSQRALRSFPVRDVVGFVRDLYTTVAEQAPTDFPDNGRGGPLERLRATLGEQARIDHHLDQRGSSAGELEELRWRYRQPDAHYDPRTPRERRRDSLLDDPAAAAAVPPEVIAFASASRFYDRSEQRETYGPLDPETTAPGPPEPTPDFHTRLTHLGDYPELLRRLGLVVDLKVRLPDRIPERSVIRVVAEMDGMSALNVPVESPWTAYDYDGEGFWSAPREQVDGDVLHGMLRIDEQELFDLLTVDVDGAALKVGDFAVNLERLLHEQNRTTVTPLASSVPSLRSAGLTVTRAGRAERIRSLLERAHEHNRGLGGEIVLHADDVTRGYRVDVHDDHTGQWRSLHARHGDYRFDSGDVADLTLDDEGYVKGASTTSKTPGPADPTPALYLHEALFGWDGWSLSAPRPGLAIASPSDGEVPRAEGDRAATGFGMTVSFTAVDGSLPRLRYGRTYRLRARATDLAGNSTRLVDDRRVTEPQRYLRFDPVISTTVVLRTRLTEGESLLRMVVRSDVGITPAEYAESPAVQVALAGYDHAYAAANERHLAPPKASQSTAELHGRFDDAFGPGGDPRRALHVARREQGTLLDRFVVDLETGRQTVPVTGIELVTPRALLTEGLPPPPTLETLRRGDALASGQYVLHTEERLLMPYLPDPLAIGVGIRGLPGVDPDDSLRVVFDGSWPEPAPFRLRLEGGSGPAEIGPDGVLTVQLPQAEVVSVRISSLIDGEGLSQLAIWDWMSEDARARLQGAAERGQLWMLTPFDEMTLVHAVQRPLTEPEIPEDLGPRRLLGETFAWFDGVIHSSAASSIRLDVQAEWSEPLDLLPDPGPTRVDGRAHAFDLRIDVDEDAARVGRDDIARAPAAPPRHRARHDFGDTKHRTVRYTATATTRFREYFPPEITADPANITRTGTVREIEVPSSARPAAPKVLYAVPTFRWQVESGADGSVVSRRRSGLRLYLERPWYSSGDGELLGVVVRQRQPLPLPPGLERVELEELREDLRWLADTVAEQRQLRFNRATDVQQFRRELEVLPDETAAHPIARRLRDRFEQIDDGLIWRLLADPVAPYVTGWGSDPIWASRPLPSARPSIDRFPSPAATRGTDLWLEELGREGPLVSVVGHPVAYNAERRLWYCDLDIDAGAAYFPFLRLALARYQPHAIPGAELSPVVLADFAQLPADRTATVVPGEAAVRVTVAGVAGTNVATPAAEMAEGAPLDLGWSRRVTVTVQRRNPDIPGDLGWDAAADPVELPATRSGEGVVWSGDVPLPTDETREPGDLRLLVTEHERLPTDADPDDPAVVEVIRGRVALRDRIVYADILPL
jgi:hypothetical protein